MGSPLSPILSNIFIKLFEMDNTDKVFNNFNIASVHYVDNVFAVFNEFHHKIYNIVLIVLFLLSYLLWRKLKMNVFLFL